MKLTWHDEVSNEDGKKLDTHEWALMEDMDFKDMECKKCGYVVRQFHETSNLYYVFNEKAIMTCDESIIYQVLL